MSTTLTLQALFCRRCGYSLLALESPRCPECGRPFDPAEPHTYLPHPPRRLKRCVVRLILATLLLVLLFASPIAWLWWGWKREQPAISALRADGTLRTRFLEVPLYGKLLGQRFHFLLERADSYSYIPGRTTTNAIPHVQRLRFLTRLTLSSNRNPGQTITDADLKHLSALTGLIDLSLLETRVTDGGLSHLKHLRRLEELSVTGGPMSGAGLAHLNDLKRIRTLLLARAAVTDDSLAYLTQFPHLERLYLAGNPITDNGLRHIGRITTLTHLSLGDTKITDEGLRHLRPLVNLTHLYLDSTTITDKGLAHLDTIRRFEELQLFGTRVTGTGLARLNLAGVTMFFFNYVPITDEGLKAIGKLSTLKQINLHGPSITDAGLGHLAGMTSLEQLSLHKTRITAEGLDQLHRLPKLEELQISESPLTREALARLNGHKSLRWVSLYKTGVPPQTQPATKSGFSFHLNVQR